MNLLLKSIRWTQSCPRTGGGLHASLRIALCAAAENQIICHLLFDISHLSFEES